MRTEPKNKRLQAVSRGTEALTLIEMMVSTTCLLVIVLGLTAMFIQTQRAFKMGLKQNDVFDNGRAIADLVARDLAQMVDTQNPNVYNCVFPYAPEFTNVIQNDNSVPPQPLRTNQLQFIYTINRAASAWASVGYALLPFSTNQFPYMSLGTLYRFAPPALSGSPTNRPPPVSPECINTLSNLYLNTFFLSTNWMTDRVADGIIHLQVRAYDTNGVEFPYRQFTNGGIVMFGLAFPAPNPTNSDLLINLPASLELELGILEPEALEHVRALGNYSAQTNYLAGRAGQVQIFRQQIPIKTARR